MPTLVFATKGAREALRHVESLTRAQKDQSEAVKQTTGKWNELDRESKRIARRQETSQEKYNRLLITTKKAFNENKISAQQYEGELNDINREYEESEGRFRSFSREGQSGWKRVAESVGTYVSAAAAASLVMEGLREVTRKYFEDIRSGQQFGIEGADAMGRLKQLAVASETPELRMNELRSMVTKFIQMGGAKDASVAASAVFSIVRAGMEDSLTDFARLAESGAITDIQTFAEALSKTQSAMGGTTGDIIGQSFAASGGALGSVEGILTGMPKIAPFAKRLGLDRAESLTMLAAVSREFGAQEGTTRLASLLADLDKQGGFRNMSVGQMVTTAQMMPPKGRERPKEAITALMALENEMDTIRELLPQVSRASGGELYRRLARVRDPSSDTARALLVQELKDASLMSYSGAIFNRLELMQNREVSERRIRGASDFNIGAMRLGQYLGTPFTTGGAISRLENIPMSAEERAQTDKLIQEYREQKTLNKTQIEKIDETNQILRDIGEDIAPRNSGDLLTVPQ